MEHNLPEHILPVIHYHDAYFTERHLMDILQSIYTETGLEPDRCAVPASIRTKMSEFTGYCERMQTGRPAFYVSDFSELHLEPSRTIPADRVAIYSGDMLLGVIHGLKS